MTLKPANNLNSVIIEDSTALELLDKSIRNLKLSISYCDIIEIPRFDNLVDLSVSDCPNLRVIPAFTELANLSVYSCPEIRVIKASPKLVDLYVEDCPKLVDIEIGSPLTGDIFIKQMNNLADLSAIKGAKSVDIDDCPELTILPQFTNCAWASISECPRISDISALKNVSKVSLTIMHFVSLSCLEQTKSLKIDYCPNVTTLPIISGLEELTILACHEITNLSVVSDMDNLTKLSITECDNVDRSLAISILQNMPKKRKSTRVNILCDHYQLSLIL